MPQPATMFEKIWNAHAIREMGEGVTLVHVDRHILQEAACSQAFDGLRNANRSVECPGLTVGVTDHVVSTKPGRDASTYEGGRPYLVLMARNCGEHRIRLFDINHSRQGIEHVVAPELGLVLPGCTVVCADSHTATNGALGTLSWGFGTSDVGHVLATQTVLQKRFKTLHLAIEGRLSPGVYAKDVILHVIGQLGTQFGGGYAVEYGGSLIRSLSIEERMTVCNMSIELGSRCGFVAPDEKTFEYLAGRPFAPTGQLWELAVRTWRTLPSDPGAVFDHSRTVDCSHLAPQITWGVTPADVTDVEARVPDPSSFATAQLRERAAKALEYLALVPGQPLTDISIDYAFIGSCTNARLSDLQAAADVVKGRKVASNVTALVVPGSSTVRREAEALGLDRVFKDAGFDWRESGCSMCLALNDDFVPPGSRCISSSNRNFEHRQGPNSRTHLASPASVAAAALEGKIADVRRYI
ncbi:3-isopropylmalate dehydratase large subunit [Bradyrhizobium sp. 14AA]